MADLQKEMKIRRRVESIFNRRREDFASLQEFGDYEEEREDIVLNLALGVDVEAMEEKIATYQRKNYDEILRNEAKKVESRRQQLEEQAPKPEPQKPGEDANSAPPEQPSTTASSFRPIDLASLPPAPVLVAGDEKVHGGNLDLDTAVNDRQKMGLVSGWHPDMPRKRALEEAFSSIFVS